MIVGLMLLILGFAWLLIETRCLTIRLSVGPNPENWDDDVKALEQPDNVAPLLLTGPNTESTFVALDMPDTNIGKLRIICVRQTV